MSNPNKAIVSLLMNNKIIPKTNLIPKNSSMILHNATTVSVVIKKNIEPISLNDEYINYSHFNTDNIGHQLAKVQKDSTYNPFKYQMGKD